MTPPADGLFVAGDRLSHGQRVILGENIRAGVADLCFRSEADIGTRVTDVRFTPESGHY